MVWIVILYFTIGLICAGLTFYMCLGLPFKTERNPSFMKMWKFLYNRPEDLWFTIGLTLFVFVFWPVMLLLLYIKRA